MGKQVDQVPLPVPSGSDALSSGTGARAGVVAVSSDPPGPKLAVPMVRTVVPVSTSRLARCLGVGVDPDDSGDLAFDPGLLERLADRGLGDGLSEVHHAAGERPVALVRAPDEHDAARPIGYDDVDGRDEGAGPRASGSS